MSCTIKECLTALLAHLPENVCHVHQSAWITPQEIPFSAEVRAMCAANRCGKYGACWTCPPGVGDWEVLRDRYQRYSESFVLTTCHALEDSFDIEGMQAAAEAHKVLDEVIANALAQFRGQYVHLSAGSCTICKKCTYPDAPCRFPSRARQSMEACGIDVVSLSRICGINYINGADTVTYFSMILL